MTQANHRVREACLICEGKGRHEDSPCAYCSGTGVVFSRTGGALINQGPAREILMATGDCKIPVKKKFAEGLSIQKRFSDA